MLTINDKSLHEQLLGELELDPRITAGDIGIAVEFGVLTLTGTVHSFLEKWAIEDAAKRIKGVRAIANDIAVELPGTHVLGDTDIAQTIASLITWDASLPKSILAEVEHGHVTLSGTVALDYQRRDAEAAVRRLCGVRSVANRIAVGPAVAPDAVKQKIESRLQRAASFDARHILVDVDGATVTLRGKTRSLAERDEVSEAAWSIPGVRNVIEKLTVEL